jgi:RND family efflux transporter MFP subunit
MGKPAAFRAAALLLLGLSLGLAGCAHTPGEAPAGGPPTVTVSHPVRREVIDYEEYTGRTAAVDSLEVRSRVSGYLTKINFQEGAEVEKNTVLYVIDPRPYRAALDQAEAQVRLAQAQLKFQEAVYQRNLSLSRTRAVAEETVQQSLEARDTARAQVNAARAAVEQARLNVEFTEVRSAISGQIGRTLITRGNLVVADQTLLTTVVSLDPMYAYFDVDEPTVEHIRDLIREGKLPSIRDKGSKIPVHLGLATEKGYPHEGYLDFVSNQVDPSTATLQVRGVFANPRPLVGPRLLTPGMFVRIRAAVSPRYRATLVNAAAIQTDQDLKFVYVLDDQNKVVRRYVTLGPEHEGLTVITKGLGPADRVIVDGIQHVRPGMVVNPRQVPMPVPRRGAPPQTPPAVIKNPVPPQPRR